MLPRCWASSCSAVSMLSPSSRRAQRRSSCYAAIPWTSSCATSGCRTSAATILRAPFALTAHERREALMLVQREVRQHVPGEIDSLENAIRPGGPLAGYRLSHGYTVLAGSGGVAVDNVRVRDPMPQLLVYAPSAPPSEW